MKSRFHACMQLALIGAMAMVAGNFICLAQSAMAQGSYPPQDQTIPSTKKQEAKPQPAAPRVQPPVGYLGGTPLYPPPGATMGVRPLPHADTSHKPADTTHAPQKPKSPQATPAQPVGRLRSIQSTTKSKPARGVQADAAKASSQNGQPTVKKPSPTSPSAARPGDKELEGDVNANFGPGGAGALPSATPAAGAKAPAIPDTSPGAKSPTAAGTGPGSKSPSSNLTSTGPSSPSVDVPTSPGAGAIPTTPLIQSPPVVKTAPAPDPLGQPTAPIPQGWSSPLPPDLTDVMKRMPPDLLRKAIPPGPNQETMRGTAPPVGALKSGQDELNEFRQQEGPNAGDISGVPTPDRVPSPLQGWAIDDALKGWAEQAFKKVAPPPLKSAYDKLKTGDRVGEAVINTGSLAPAGREVQGRVNDFVVGGIADQLKDQVKDVLGTGPGTSLVNKGIDKAADAAKDVAKKAEDEIIFGGQDFNAPGPAPPGPDGFYGETTSPYLEKNSPNQKK